jgi:hypothetical protein
MAYSAEISRANPTCFIFVLDQSGSMLDSFGGSSSEVALRKADFLADVVNRTLYDLIMRCTKPEEIRNYYEIAIIGYGDYVGSVLSGPLQAREFVPISELADNPIRVESRAKKVPDGAGDLVEQQIKFPVWVDARASKATPMCSAMAKVKDMLEKWVSDPKHRTSFPPTILHISDGESTDGDPSLFGQQIRSLSTNDGEAIFYNCHLSSERATKIEYPSSSENLPNQYAKMLFEMSTILPAPFRSAAQQIGFSLQENARGFVFNADAVSLAQFFDIGTRPANLR